MVFPAVLQKTKGISTYLLNKGLEQERKIMAGSTLIVKFILRAHMGDSLVNCVFRM